MSTVFFAGSMLESVERNTLNALEQSKVRLGALVHAGNQQPSFEKAQMGIRQSDSVAPELIIFKDKLTDNVLAEAAAVARNKPGLTLFVGEHCIERSRALEAGFDAAIPHPQLIFEVMNGHDLTYARITGINGEYRDGRLTRLINLPAVSVYLSASEQGKAYVITSTRIAEVLRRMGFGVTIFGKHHDPQLTDLYLVRDDRKVPDGIDPEAYSREYLGQTGKAGYIVDWVDDALLLALSQTISIEEIHFPGAKHGHSLRLMADTGLSAPGNYSLISGQLFPAESLLKANTFNSLTVDEINALHEGINAKTIDRLHAPYVGRTLLRAGGKEHHIQSRYLKHPQNKIVAEALLEHFKQIGGDLLKVEPRCFEVGGGEKFFNIEADLPGSDPNTIVIVSAHFDSIAEPAGTFPAPGADDDASGMAGVLAAAEVAVRLRRESKVALKRTLRFVLFNAEEGGVYGSRKYAVYQRSKNAQIVGVFQMDMIGFRGSEPSVFEIHAGYSYLPYIETASLILADRVRNAAALLSRSLINDHSPQIYSTENGIDPAEGYSDHTQFHRQRYPACMISEDYNTDAGDPHPDPHYNEDYHTSKDRAIDCAYAAEIARAVAGAAILSAKN